MRIVTLGILTGSIIADEYFECQIEKTCTACINTSPICAWCEDLENDGNHARCQDNNYLIQNRNCSNIIFPESGLTGAHKDTSRRFRRDSENHKSKKKNKKKKNKNKKKKSEVPGSSVPLLLGASALGASTKLKSSKRNSASSLISESAFSSDYIEVSLRAHDEFKFSFTFTMPKYQPLDLYFLFDLSFSMKQDLNNLVEYSKTLFELFLELYPEQAADNFRVGFGSFVDKRLMPAASENPEMKENPCKLDNPNSASNQFCKSNFVFENNLPLEQRSSEEFSEFLKENVFVSSNIDFNEAGLDALMQTAICDQIKWHENSRKMIVYVSDAGFHTQGDGILNGVLLRHDEKCHLVKNIERDGDVFDYPSMGQTARVLNDRNIMVGFTFSDDTSVDLEHVKQSYKDLEELVANSELQMMNSKDDIKETAKQIFDLYKRLAYRAIVEIEELPKPGLPFGWEIKSTRHFDENGNLKETPKEEDGSLCLYDCTNVLPEHSVEYTMKVRHLETGGTGFSIPEDPEIHVGAVEEVLTVNMKLIDTCDCSNKKDDFEPCDGNDLECGVCDCGEGYDEKECKVDTTAPNCFGVGNCVCGVCHCPKNYEGDFCECNKLTWCNGGDCGHGECIMEPHSTIQNCEMSCQCDSGWNNNQINGACTCNDDNHKCKDESGLECGGKLRGECSCDECFCNIIHNSDNEKIGSFTGELCADFEGECDRYEELIQCMAQFCVDKQIVDCWEKAAESCESEILDLEFKSISFGFDGMEYPIGVLEVAEPTYFKQRPACSISIKLPGWINGELDCKVYFGLYLEDSTLTLKTQIHKESGDIWDTILKCPTDPNVVTAASVGGTLLLGALIILIAFLIMKFCIYRMNLAEVAEHNKSLANTSYQVNPIHKTPVTKHNPDEESRINEGMPLMNSTKIS